VRSSFVDLKVAGRDLKGRAVVQAFLYNYALNETVPGPDHHAFLRNLFEHVLEVEADSRVLLLGKSDRKNRSGDPRVNLRVSKERAEQAAGDLKYYFHKKGIDSTGRIGTIALSDADAVAHGDAAQSENTHERAVEVQVRPRTP